MVKQCVVCNIKYNLEDNVCVFHKLPQEGSITRKKWIGFVRKHVNKYWMPVAKNKYNDVICSLHFSLDDYHEHHVGNLTLKQLAYPKIFGSKSAKKSSVQLDAKSSTSSSTPDEVMELLQSTSPEEIDSPSVMSSQVGNVQVSDEPCYTSTGDII